jgi:hypothetical protein
MGFLASAVTPPGRFAGKPGRDGGNGELVFSEPWESRARPGGALELLPAPPATTIAKTIETTTISTRTDPPDDGRARYAASE